MLTIKEKEKIGIIDYYKDKTMFMTGCSGFMGISLIEKLIRSVEFKKMYLLIRRGVTLFFIFIIY